MDPADESAGLRRRLRIFPPTYVGGYGSIRRLTLAGQRAEAEQSGELTCELTLALTQKGRRRKAVWCLNRG